MPTRKPIKYSINGNGLKSHKSFTLASNMVLMRLAERVRCTNFLSSLLNVYFHPSVFQSLPQLIYLRNDPHGCLHCTKVWHKTYLIVDCKTVGFFLKISKEIGKAWRAREPHTPLVSASFQTFCLTARAYLNTQKYGLFCSLI